MTSLEPNPLSIRHDVVFAEFREFGMSNDECQDGRQKIANRLCDSTFYGILMNPSVNLIGILVVKSYCIYFLQRFVKTAGTHFALSFKRDQMYGISS